MPSNFFIQLLAVAAFLIFAGSFHAKTRKSILLWQVASLVVWIVHYSLLDAQTGLFLILSNLVITVLFLYRDKLRWINNPYALYATLVGIIVVTIVTWEGFYSVFALSGITSITIAKWQNDPSQMRRISILASIFWIGYDLFVGSWGGVVAEIITVISIITSLVRRNSPSVK
jgi:hypothetical protein